MIAHFLHGSTTKEWSFYRATGSCSAFIATGSDTADENRDGTQRLGGLRGGGTMEHHRRHPCGEDCIASTFLTQHPEYKWQEPYLKDMKSNPWTLFEANR